MKGLTGLKEHEFNVPVTPVSSPALVPAYTSATRPYDVFPSPTAQILFPSGLQSKLLAFAKKLSYCCTVINRSGQISLIINTPLASIEATNLPSKLNFTAVTSDRCVKDNTGFVGS